MTLSSSGQPHGLTPVEGGIEHVDVAGNARISITHVVSEGIGRCDLCRFSAGCVQGTMASFFRSEQTLAFINDLPLRRPEYDPGVQYSHRTYNLLSSSVYVNEETTALCNPNYPTTGFTCRAEIGRTQSHVNICFKVLAVLARLYKK